ncbi:MAG TPA: acyl-CoA dehydrogenase [Clostridiaceae bacterium]|nr:acyl-CoA dehydrogenase [Clostridiaceae bacterium]
MDYKLTQEQEMIRKVMRKFALEKVEPIAADIDEQEIFPEENVKLLAEMGVMGMIYPKEYGGSGTDSISYAIAIEELSKVCATTGCIVASHNSLACGPIFYYGTKEQKEKYLPDLVTGRKIGGFGLTEPNAGTDSAAQETTAVLVDDEYYLLNGSKMFITNGGVAETFVIFAMTDKSQGNRGISAFIVEGGWEGFSRGPHEKKMGIRGSSTCELIFENVKVPKENLLGREGQGFKIAMQTLDSGRIGIAAQALGIAQGALDEAIEYSKTRIQFGRPISTKQGLQWMMADMHVRTEAARQLVYRAAYAKDHQKRFTEEAAMAKLYASEAAMWVTTKAVQIHGGYGFTRDYPVERMMRDAKITEIYEGTSEVQRMVISGSILR